MGTGTSTVSRPIHLLGMNIYISPGYNFRSDIIIPEQNLTHCHPMHTPTRSWSKLDVFVQISCRPLFFVCPDRPCRPVSGLINHREMHCTPPPTALPNATFTCYFVGSWCVSADTILRRTAGCRVDHLPIQSLVVW
jgi:hypothetical protein